MRPANLCTITEHYLNNKAELCKLTKDQLQLFWDQRTWHPMIHSIWVAETDSDGKGKMTYPDGTVSFY